MDRSMFGNIIEGTDKGRRRGTTVRMLDDLLRTNPKAMVDFLDAIRAGASWNAAAAFLRVKPDTVQRWMLRGKTAKSGPYSRFYRQTMQALQESTIVAEAKVKERNPELWLRNGPGRLVNEQWRDDGKQVDVMLEGSITQGGKLQVQHVDVVAALKELQKAGVPLEHLTMSAIEMPGEDGSGDDDLDDDQVNTMGTNYLGDGKWKSTLPSLPEPLAERSRLSQVDQDIREKTNGEVTTVKPKNMSILERMKALK